MHSLREVLGWLRDLAEALAYMHMQVPAIGHGDLKLDNILIHPNDGGPLIPLGLTFVFGLPALLCIWIGAAKGHSPMWCGMWGLLSYIGVMVLAFYPDKNTTPQTELHFLHQDLSSELLKRISVSVLRRWADVWIGRRWWVRATANGIAGFFPALVTFPALIVFYSVVFGPAVSGKSWGECITLVFDFCSTVFDSVK